MKISLHMIKPWLEKYNPVVSISEGSRSITGARLFSEELEIHSDYLYVGRMSDFFQDNPSQEVLLMHHQDVISVNSDDLNMIFNQVLSAMDFYSNLENRLLGAVFQKNPEQYILSCCEQLLGPMFIMTPDYHILACSQNFSDKYVNIFWESFTLHKEPSLQTIYDMQNSVVHQLSLSDQHMTIYREPTAYPYDYGVMNTYKNAAGKKIGSFILASDKPISAFDLDMASIICDALHQIHVTKEVSLAIAQPETADAILLERLIDMDDLVRTEELFKTIHPVDGNTRFYIMIAKCAEIFLLHPLLEDISRRFMNSVSLIKDNYIVTLIWGTGDFFQQIHTQTQRIARSLPVTFGLSNPSHEISPLHYFYLQAMLAVRSVKNVLCYFSDIAVASILDSSDDGFKWFAKHPGILYLEQYDYHNHTELTRTLQIYLSCERSIKRAAALLYIHRNTVLYRIDRINEMKLFDLEDNDERQYIMLSCCLNKSR